ncbi:hypothetical protein BRO54_0577 [Geobacillus proteiniphilus]|uniref:Uncharacterized protein n=1 Tax=Geobacillus proteiniphilus TaxID=860353 RepID=A0A1Q5T7E3_9BACL|nr:hypothetical protein BRO54_0577 [Geobacillus proteiniphilus]
MAASSSAIDRGSRWRQTFLTKSRYLFSQKYGVIVKKRVR